MSCENIINSSPHQTSSANSTPTVINMNTRILKLLVVATILAIAQATKFHPFVSVAVKRNLLADDEFNFSFKKEAEVTKIPGIRLEDIRPPNARLLGLSDVDVSFIRVFMAPGSIIPLHVHPRGVESQSVNFGTLEVTIFLEGLMPRRVLNRIPRGSIGSVPQGLLHQVKCVGKKGCAFIVFFNSADPGTSFVPMK